MTSIALVDAPEKQALRLCHAQRQGGWVNRPYLAFPKTDRHLHEQFLLQREWQPARCRFEHVDPTPRQNAEQGFGLHVTGRERIREEPDEIDIQTCAISQHANFIGMQQKNVAFRIRSKLNCFVNPRIGAVGKLGQ